MNGLMMQQPLLISSLLRHVERHHSEQWVVSRQVEGGIHRYTYRDMASRARRVAKAMGALGVQPNERVGTIAWNGYRHLELYYGVSGSGAVLHTLNPRLHPDQLVWIADHAQDKPKVLGFAGIVSETPFDFVDTAGGPDRIRRALDFLQEVEAVLEPSGTVARRRIPRQRRVAVDMERQVDRDRAVDVAKANVSQARRLERRRLRQGLCRQRGRVSQDGQRRAGDPAHSIHQQCRTEEPAADRPEGFPGPSAACRAVR